MHNALHHPLALKVFQMAEDGDVVQSKDFAQMPDGGGLAVLRDVRSSGLVDANLMGVVVLAGQETGWDAFA